MEQHYHVVLPDLRGYGDSSLPDAGPDNVNYSFRAMAQDVVEIIHAEESNADSGRNIGPELCAANLVVVDFSLSPQHFQVFGYGVPCQAQPFGYLFRLDARPGGLKYLQDIGLDIFFHGHW